ncbi:MAG: ammonium transporter, partial [Acidimicrobiales bacterium]
TLPVLFLFQAAFAAAAATIVSGAMAERTRFVAYMVYTVAITGLIYPVVVNWLWGGGWLAEMGFYDFAGSTIVHSVGGWAALAGAWTLGPRIGRFDADGKPRPMAGASIPLAVVGAFLLFVGWFGFNPGSELAADLEVPRIAVTTLLSAGAGATMAMLISWRRLGHPDVSVAANGLLAGLVGITAGTFLVGPLAAVAIGLVSGVVVILGEALLLRLRIDDPVGAVAVHAFCGVWGTLAVGLFASRGALVDPSIFDGLGLAGEGLFYGGGFGLLVDQIVGTVAVAVFVLGASTILFRTLKAVDILRISEDQELQGQDFADLGLASTNPPSELVVDLSYRLGSDPEEILARSVGEKLKV